jgi:magnesium-transporting ATPase (P-type)
MDTLGALALATEPPNGELMKRPPVSKLDDFITKAMWRNIIGQSVYQLIVLGILISTGKHLLGISGSDADTTLNTFIFNTFVFCQVNVICILHSLFSVLAFLFFRGKPCQMHLGLKKTKAKLSIGNNNNNKAFNPK